MKTYFPIAAWLLLLLFADPAFLDGQWECALVMFAALALVPTGVAQMGLPQSNWYWLAALSFCAAYWFNSPGAGYSDALALPYSLWAVWLTLRTATGFLTMKKISLAEWVRVFALGYWATGAFWALCYLIGIQPVGFDPVIVSLTAAHFHVAGFVLAVVVWNLLTHENSALNRLLALGVLAGMPLVAAGITLSKLGFPSWIEMVAAVAFALMALVVVVQHVRLGFNGQYPIIARRYWLTGVFCLTIGAALAGLYGLRFVFPLDFIHIPNMKIWHGTLNALGFGWCVLQGWDVLRRQ